jgi:ribosomal protein S18 acetylase RimI-like enzyme
MTVLVKHRIAVRTPAERDVPGLVALVNLLAAETSSLFIMPIEGPDGEGTLRTYLASITQSGNEVVLVADCDGEMAGLLSATRGAHPAKRGGATIGIGVKPQYRGCGVGRALMAGIDAWARENGLDRLDLTVVTDNYAALSLYRSFGYEEEGLMRASARVDGKPIDQILMAKLL